MDILDRRKVKTRKPHICHGCQTLIPSKTENVEYSSIADNGEIYSLYTCEVCKNWITRNPDYFDDGTYSEGDIREAMIEEGEWVFKVV